MYRNYNTGSYFVFKDNPFPPSQGPVRSNISGAALSSHLICDIVVSNAQAGAVIGRQGSHIKAIMSKSRALVAVSSQHLDSTIFLLTWYYQSTKEKGIQWSVDHTEELNCWNML